MHIPYWKLWEIKDSDLRADIIISNHNLVEFHVRALRFYLQYSKTLLKDSKYKLLVAQTGSGQVLRNIEYVMRIINLFGFRLVYQDDLYYIFQLEDFSRTHYNPTHTKLLSEETVIEVDKDNEIYKEIKEKRESYNKAKKVSIEDIHKFYDNLKAGDTPDEEFIHYIGFNYI